jgi:hypothetical protein
MNRIPIIETRSDHLGVSNQFHPTSNGLSFSSSGIDVRSTHLNLFEGPDTVSRIIQTFLQFGDKLYKVLIPENCGVDALLGACLEALPNSFTLDNLRLYLPDFGQTVAYGMANCAPLPLKHGSRMHVMMSLPGGAI